MKKSELRKIIREELDKLFEKENKISKSHKKGDVWRAAETQFARYAGKNKKGITKYFDTRKQATMWASTSVDRITDLPYDFLRSGGGRIDRSVRQPSTTRKQLSGGPH